MKFLIVSLLIVFLIYSFAFAEDIQIYTSTTKGMTYYHIKYILTPENTLLPNDPKVVVEFGLKRNAENYRKEIIDEQSINFKGYGQFEIFIPVEEFLFAHHKSGYVIVRMPQTLGDNEYSTHSKDTKGYDCVVEKQALYNRIKEMKESGKGSVDVVIELNPYVRVKSKNPLELELTNRNVFFRSAHGRYIDYVRQLYSQKPRINKKFE